MTLTKFSQKNLMVLENFILHITHSSEGDHDAKIAQSFSPNDLYELARGYIAEDHVDGEGSEEAMLEIAYHSELIIEETYLDEEDDDEEYPYNVYANADTGLIYAVRLENKEVSIYKLTKPQDVIEVEHRDEILEYQLAKYTPDDFVTLGDIFSHAKYIEKIYPLD